MRISVEKTHKFGPLHVVSGKVLDVNGKVLATARYQDHLYGLPWVMMPVVLYYNKDHFDAAKLPYPDRSWDWAHFRATGRASDLPGSASGIPGLPGPDSLPAMREGR